MLIQQAFKNITCDTLFAKTVVIGQEVQKSHPTAPDWFVWALIGMFIGAILWMARPINRVEYDNSRPYG